jgi:hypothetical protein
MLFLIAMGVVLESEDRRSHVVNYEDFLQQTYSIVQPNIISGAFYSELNYEVLHHLGSPWCRIPHPQVGVFISSVNIA